MSYFKRFILISGLISGLIVLLIAGTLTWEYYTARQSSNHYRSLDSFLGSRIGTRIELTKLKNDFGLEVVSEESSELGQDYILFSVLKYRFLTGYSEIKVSLRSKGEILVKYRVEEVVHGL